MRLLSVPATVPRLFPFVPGTLMTALRAVLGSVGLGIPAVFLEFRGQVRRNAPRLLGIPPRLRLGGISRSLAHVSLRSALLRVPSLVGAGIGAGIGPVCR